ncbi:MAG: pantoate--beta-alanine ligase [Pseudomonadota bacterium]
MIEDGLKTVRTVADLRDAVRAWRADGDSVGLVTTMGALHAGHLSLVKTAASRCDRVVATIFVNPTQFNDPSDLDKYPRREDEDAGALMAAGTNLLFAPSADEMYPEAFDTTVSVGALSAGLEGGHRPGHFDGVATVVCKLLLQSMPDIAFFGEKDYQQLRVVTRMSADLNIPTEIQGVPTVREADGLAMSSRNEHLTAAEREIAPALAQALHRVAEAVAAGQAAGPVVEQATADLLSAGFQTVDYIAVCDASTLKPLDRLSPGTPARVLAAANLGAVRLIDNIAVGG